MVLAYHGTPYITELIEEKTLFCNLLVHSHPKARSRMFDKRYADYTESVAEAAQKIRIVLKEETDEGVRGLSGIASDEELLDQVVMRSGGKPFDVFDMYQYREDIRRCFVFLYRKYTSAKEYATPRNNTIEKYMLPHSVLEFDLPQEMIREQGSMILVKREVPLVYAKRIYCDKKERISELLRENNLTHIEISDLI